MEFERHYNDLPDRNDHMLFFRSGRCELFFGFGTDNGVNFCWHKDYQRVPSLEELRSDIEGLVNSQTDERILTGYVWRGSRVWLSTENQFNYKAAYDLAVQTNGATLPVTFKLGEDDGVVVYHTFDDLEEFTEFYTGAIAFVNQCLSDGWAEKDAVDYNALLNG